MENKNEIIDYLDKKFDEISDLVKISIFNQISDNIKNSNDETLEPELKTKLGNNGYKIVKIEEYGEKNLIYISSEEKTRVGNIRNILKKLKSYQTNYTFVFLLENIGTLQQKKLINENISFEVVGKIKFIVSE